MKMHRHTELASALSVVLLLIGLPYGAPLATIKVVGDRVYHPKAPQEYLQTYVILPKDHTSDTAPLAVGLELTDGFVRAANQLPLHYSINIPLSPTTTFNYSAFEQTATLFPRVGKNPFSFLYWSFGFNGHPPVGVYDVQHFDFHFVFTSPEDWWGAQWGPGSQGPCMGGSNATFFKSFKPIPASCWPGDVAGPVTQMGDFVWGMGSHLFDLSAPEFNPPRHFNSTQIYGQYGGEIAYFEAMISLATMQRSRGYQECISLKNNPRASPVPRMLPGELCMERKLRGFTAEYRKFAPVAVGCSATGGKYGGAYPATAPQLPPQLCTVPPKVTP